MPYVDPSDRQSDGLAWSEHTPARAQADRAQRRPVPSSNPSEVRVIDHNRTLSPDGVYGPSLDRVPLRWCDGIHSRAAGGQLA